MKRGTPLKIFVASGSELINERRETIQVVHELRKVFPSLNLEAVEWETDIPSGSYDKQLIQDKINPLLEQCEVVLVLFYSKIGTFTLEEFRLAMAKNKKVFLYFKTGFSPKNKIEYDNYGKVLEFRAEIKRENRVLPKEYDTPGTFKNILYKNLNLYLSQTYIQAAPGGPGGGEGKESLPVRLYRGSKKYSEALRGPNGRFKFLRISDIILPGTGDEWLETCAVLNNKKFCGGPGGGFLKEPPGRRRHKDPKVLEVLPLLWTLEIKHTVIVGDGGMGKTVSLIQWWKKLLETEGTSRGDRFPCL